MKTIREISKIVRRDAKKRLLAILLLAFVTRLAFVLVLNPHGFYFSDTRHYDGAALSLLSGDGFGDKYNRSPVYPMYMALIYTVFGHSFLAVRFIEALLGVLLVWLVYKIAGKIFNEKIATLSALIAAAFPHFIILAGLLYPTNLFTVLLAAGLWLLLRSEEKDRVHLTILSALCTGLAALTIPAMFFILPFWLFWLMIRLQRPARYNFIITSIFMLVVLVTLTPWTVRNFHKYDRLTLVRPVPHTAFPNLADLEAQKQRIANGFEDTTEYLKKNPTGTEKDQVGAIIGNYFRHPLQSIKYLLSELSHFWALYPDRLDTASCDYQKKVAAEDSRMVRTKSALWRGATIASICVMAPVFTLAFFGLVVSRPTRRYKILLLLTILGMTAGYSLIYAEVRYRIPIEPYVVMFTAIGLARLRELALAAHRQRMSKRQELAAEQSVMSLPPVWSGRIGSSDEIE